MDRKELNDSQRYTGFNYYQNDDNLPVGSSLYKLARQSKSNKNNAPPQNFKDLQEKNRYLNTLDHFSCKASKINKRLKANRKAANNCKNNSNQQYGGFEMYDTAVPKSASSVLPTFKYGFDEHEKGTNLYGGQPDKKTYRFEKTYDDELSTVCHINKPIPWDKVFSRFECQPEKKTYPLDRADELPNVHRKKKGILVPWNKLYLCFERTPWTANWATQLPSQTLKPNYTTNYNYGPKGGFNQPRGHGVLYSPSSSCTELDKIPSCDDYWPISPPSNRGKSTPNRSYGQNSLPNRSYGQNSLPNRSYGQNKSNMTIYSGENSVEPTVANITAVSHGRNKSNATSYSTDRFGIATDDNKSNVTTRTQGRNKSNMTGYSSDLSGVTTDNPMNFTSRSIGRNKSNVTIYSPDVSQVSIIHYQESTGSNQNENHIVDVFDEIARNDGGKRLANELKKMQLLNATREDLGKFER